MPYTHGGVAHYYEFQATRPERPVLVFVHGWGGSSRYWQSTMTALSEEFSCLVFDSRGFGRTAADTGRDFTLETYAEDLDQLLTELGIEKIYLNAHSLGASTAVLFANRYPARVEKLVLTCSGVFNYEPVSFKLFHIVGGWVVAFRPPWFTKIPLAHRAFEQRFVHRALPEADSREFLADFVLADYGAALGTMLDAVSEKAARIMPGAFSQLTVPTLLIAGQYDKIIPVAMARAVVPLNPQVRLEVMAKCGHFPMLEQPQVYQQLLLNFLQATDPIIA
ncbi:alpha/beta fold hydrolase [Candidatus Cyanaurora vandensis]|uniref:alpha/beta fold hydrolase n=1 Tax=Candidatus Cyanaurora vandensis TaxID=2714958 RepID=UPI00257B8003|nr:alpha/beta hydrolase [Candidatus Cyanaurora vandensis]